MHPVQNLGAFQGLEPMDYVIDSNVYTRCRDAQGHGVTGKKKRG